MDMSINQRLANFLYEKKISQEELRIKLGLKTRQQVSNWLNCRDHIPDKHLMGIIRLFPELNANWLIREIGSPLIDQKSLRQINRNEFGFCEECLEKDKEIETLKTLLLKKEEEIEKKEKEMRESCRGECQTAGLYRQPGTAGTCHCLQRADSIHENGSGGYR